MSEAARLRAQKAHSTDPDYLERMALAEEARAQSQAAAGAGSALRLEEISSAAGRAARRPG
jgi:hypothetical protein